jgi:hypothetical protein
MRDGNCPNRSPGHEPETKYLIVLGPNVGPHVVSFDKFHKRISPTCTALRRLREMHRAEFSLSRAETLATGFKTWYKNRFIPPIASHPQNTQQNRSNPPRHGPRDEYLMYQGCAAGGNHGLNIPSRATENPPLNSAWTQCSTAIHDSPHFVEFSVPRVNEQVVESVQTLVQGGMDQKFVSLAAPICTKSGYMVGIE